MADDKNTNKSSQRRAGGKTSLKSFLGGNILASEKVVAQLPFVFFLVFLGMLLIANRYWAEKTIREMEAVQGAIKELKAEAVTLETELMKVNRPSEIADKVRATGIDLAEPLQPARKLKVKKIEHK